MTLVKPGDHLRSRACTTEVIVVRAPSIDTEICCGGVPMANFVFRDGYEYVLMIAVVATALAALGPGRASLDHAAGINFAGTAGALTALVAGFGGAALLLATSWRPASVKRADEPAAEPVPAVSED